MIKYILILIALTGCGKEEIDEYKIVQEIRVVCGDLGVEKLLSNFTLECIKNANPKSDEEPEDWIEKCLDMAEQIYCPVVTVNIEMVKLAGSDYWSTINIEKDK